MCGLYTREINLKSYFLYIQQILYIFIRVKETKEKCTISIITKLKNRISKETYGVDDIKSLIILNNKANNLV